MKTDIWKKAEALTVEYIGYNLNEVIDYEKYKLYAIVTSSTQLEGSTLDELDTKLLLDDGLTAKGKPLDHHLMVRDNYNALRFALDAAGNKSLLSPEFLCQCNALNMAETGFVRSTITGTVDGRKGEFRQTSAFSEALGYYAEFSKIPEMLTRFCEEYNRQMSSNKSIADHLKTSFDAHANLVLIHPWMDGNKRTSRLIMNFVQKRAGIPLTKVHKEDSREYLNALKEAKDTGNLELFRDFMCRQHLKTLQVEIQNYKRESKRGFNMIF